MYYPNMRQYSHHGPSPATGEKPSQNAPKQAAIKFLIRYGRKAAISLAVYLLSCLPYIGRFVLPAASFYTFNKQVGTQPALIIFGSSIFLPKRYLVHFLQSYFASRSLMRELVSTNQHFRDVCVNLTAFSARALLLSHSLHSPAEEGLVPRSRRCPLRLWRRLLCLPQDPSARRPYLRHRRSIYCFPYHKGD